MSNPKQSERHVAVYTDGACIRNPGPGGWSVILMSMKGDHEIKRKQLSGYEADTTNNRMELTAVIRALEALKSDRPATIHTDSQYVSNGITKWIHAWKERGWRKSNGKPVINRDLWERLYELVSTKNVIFEWVPAHSGIELNEAVDRLAYEAALVG